MTKVISVVNQKGGVGKTTTSLNFAYELANKGKKVLLVDFDTQGNLTSYAGIFEGSVDNIKTTIATALENVIDGKNAELEVYKSPVIDNLDIVPCNIEMAHIKLKMMNALAREQTLKRVLNTVKENYDYIVIDTAPSLDIDMINSLVASDEIIITSTPDTFSESGVKGLFKSIEQIKNTLNKELEIKGVLITMFDSRTNFSKAMTEVIKMSWDSKIKVFDEMIPISIKVKESQAMHIPISKYDKQNKVGKAYIKFTEEYIKSKEI